MHHFVNREVHAQLPLMIEGMIEGLGGRSAIEDCELHQHNQQCQTPHCQRFLTGIPRMNLEFEADRSDFLGFP